MLSVKGMKEEIIDHLASMGLGRLEVFLIDPSPDSEILELRLKYNIPKINIAAITDKILTAEVLIGPVIKDIEESEFLASLTKELENRVEDLQKKLATETARANALAHFQRHYFLEYALAHGRPPIGVDFRAVFSYGATRVEEDTTGGGNQTRD